GKIADGRNRYRACLEAKVRPKFEHWEGEGSLVSLVISRNIHRRHLDRSQLAVIAAEAIPLFEAEAAAKKQSPAEPKEGRAQICARPTSGKAAENAAKAMGSSTRSVENAKRVLDHGTPELVDAVR